MVVVSHRSLFRVDIVSWQGIPFPRWKHMKKNLVCQDSDELDHKIWGAVSVIVTRKNTEFFLRPLNLLYSAVHS